MAERVLMKFGRVNGITEILRYTGGRVRIFKSVEARKRNKEKLALINVKITANFL